MSEFRGQLISAAFGFFGVLLGTAIVPWVRGRLSRRRAARYLAIRVTCILDKFVEDCASTAIDDGEEDENHISVARKTAPPSPTYPPDMDWHSIDYPLMYQLLALPAAADRASRIVDAASECACPPDYSEYFEARSKQYSLLGLQAHALTDALRTRYAIPPVGNMEWDPVDCIHRKLQEIADLQKKRIEAWGALPSSPASPV